MIRKTQQDMQDLLQCFYLKEMPPLGLKYAENIFKIKADFSDESLKQIDEILLALHHQNIRPNDLVTEKDGLNFLMMVIGYLCDVISQRTQQKVEWYNYYEAIKILPSDYELPLDFFSSMVAMINHQVCLPLIVISDLLHHGEASEHTCLTYMHSRQTVIEDSSTRNINEYCAHYVQALQQHAYISGGNAYRKATDLIDFDFSLASIQKIDLLLNSIRQHEQLNPSKYADFIQNKEKCNFLVALSYYLGTTIAHQTLSSVKWFSFEEYKAMFSQDENESFRYELAQVFVFQNQISFPMSVLSAILFDASQPVQSCLEYVQKYIALSSDPLVYFPSSLKDVEQPEITANIIRAFKHAGFLAGYASFMLDGSVLNPCLLVTKDNKIQIIKLMQDNPREKAFAELENNPQNHPFQIFCEDIHAYLPTGRTDAIYLKIHIYTPIESSVSLVIPYTKNADNKIEDIYSVVQYTPSDLSLAQFEAAMTAFYQSAFEFQDSFTQQPFWQAHFKDKILRRPATYLLDPHLHDEIIEQFKASFDEIISSTSQQNSSEINSLQIDLKKQISELPENLRAYLQVIPPDWMFTDELFKQIEAMPTFYTSGRVVWAALVQANKLMFEPGDVNCPGEIVFDPTGQMDIEQLHDYAKALYQLKNTTPVEADQLAYAEHISNEITRVVNYPYPQSLSKIPLKISSIWFWRLHLPNGMLSLPIFPIILCDDPKYAGEAMVCPSLFWPQNLVELWLKTGTEQYGKEHKFDLSYIQKKLMQFAQKPNLLHPKLNKIFNNDESRFDQTTTLSETTKSSITPANTPVQAVEVNKETSAVDVIPEVSNPALIKALEILKTNQDDQEKVQQAIGIIASLVMNDDPEAMQLMAHFHTEGKYVEKDSKQAFFYLVETAKIQMDEASFKNAMRFYASASNDLNKNDPEIEEWLLGLAAEFDRATAEKPEVGQLNGSTTRRRHINKIDQPLTTAQWINRILIGISVVLILIIFFK